MRSPIGHRALVSALVALVVAASCVRASFGQQARQSLSQQPSDKLLSSGAAVAPKASEKTSAAEEQHQTDKKQAEQASALDASLLEEYVQIKPEEMAGEAGKELDASALALQDAPSASSGAQSAGDKSLAAEHKQADDELSAHLAPADSISALESAPAGYAQQQQHIRAAPRARYAPAGPPARAQPQPMHHPQRPAPYGSGARGARSPGAHGGQVVNAPRGYLAMARGKLGGSLYSAPASGQPVAGYGAHPAHVAGAAPSPQQQVYGPAAAAAAASSSRYLPRGAAAGYAAFREFVRAQAHKYKQSGFNAAEASTGYDQAPAKYPNEATYLGGQQDNQQDAYGGAKASAGANPQKATKVSVAQAYIPQPLAPTNKYQAPQASAQDYQQQAQLNKLYGDHAPQGVGRPEYNKDYGMVIHYPRATVYTEPMTVEQVHKLAGSSITQILEQLQYSLASGQTAHIRDESNTIRPNQKHHLGSGLTLQAKEFYAPGKGGHYVPHTAAVISHSAPGKSAQSYQPAAEQQAAEYPQPPEPAPGYGPQMDAELGAGYERVKAAVANSAKYSAPAASHYQAAREYARPPAQQQQQQQQPAAYRQQKPAGLVEPLGAIASLIGGELESLYNKANSVLSKQLDPEIHAHIQTHIKSLASIKGPLKMSHHDSRYPLALTPVMPNGAPKYGGPPQARYPGAGAPMARPPRSQPSGYQPRRPAPYSPHQQQSNRYQAPGRARPQQQQQQQSQRQQKQNQHYKSKQADAAAHKQMMQMLHEFQMGDEQYGTKSQPAQAGSSQGYPNKVVQYRQQQQQQYQQQQHSPNTYEHAEGLEIPQGPNDQIGEISELLETLKGTLEQHNPESNSYGGQKQQQPAAAKDPAKTEDVRYLASALGQVPSYAIQVPVGQPAQQASIEQAYGAQQQAYGVQPQGPAQQQQQQQYYQTGAADQSYGQQQAQNAYAQQAQQPQPAADYGQQSGPSYAPTSYGQAVQQQQAPEAYGQQPAQAYGQQQQRAYSGPLAPAPSTHQQQPSAATQAYQPQPQPQQAEQSYTSNEHTTVINHLVPVQQQAVAAPAVAAAPVAAVASQSYGSSSDASGQQQQVSYEQPISQLTIGAPDANAYQSAQSLSSFVDSLGEYHEELLRQPVAAAQVASVAGAAPAAPAGGYQSLEGAASEQQQLRSEAAPLGKEQTSSAAKRTTAQSNPTSSSSAIGVQKSSQSSSSSSSASSQTQTAAQSSPSSPTSSSSSSSSSSGASARAQEKK